MQIEIKSKPGIVRTSKRIEDLYVKILTSPDIIEWIADNGRKIDKHKTLVFTYQNNIIIELLVYEHQMDSHQIQEQFDVIENNVTSNKQKAYPLYRKELSEDKEVPKTTIQRVKDYLQRSSRRLFGKK